MPRGSTAVTMSRISRVQFSLVVGFTNECDAMLTISVCDTVQAEFLSFFSACPVQPLSILVYLDAPLKQ